MVICHKDKHYYLILQTPWLNKSTFVGLQKGRQPKQNVMMDLKWLTASWYRHLRKMLGETAHRHLAQQHLISG